MEYLRSLLANKYFWGGLAALALLGLVLYALVDFAVMPALTLQHAQVTVPEVRKMDVEQARAVLADQDLRPEVIVQRYNPAYAPNAVVEQSPAAETLVKPNRRIYLTVNSAGAPQVSVPGLEGLSIREAENRLRAAGLRLGEVQPDTIPSQYLNTITRQQPASGEAAAEGARVDLWYATGLGAGFAVVPDVIGKPVGEAQAILLEAKIRSVVVAGDEGIAADSSQVVRRQSREPGSQVREGFELRLFLNDGPEAPGE